MVVDIKDTNFGYVFDHCNFIETIKLSHETNLPSHTEKFELLKVIVVTRHGDRSPLKPVAQMDSVDCQSIVFSSADRQREESKYLQIVEELKDKQVELQKYKYPASWLKFSEKCTTSTLNEQGIAQMVKTGYLLCQAYSKKLNLTAETIGADISVKSTNTSRTFQSAVSFLFAFYKCLGSNMFTEFPKITIFSDSQFCDKSPTTSYCRIEAFTRRFVHIRADKVFPPDVYRRFYEFRKHMGYILRANNKVVERNTSSPRSILDKLNVFLCRKHALPCHKVYGCASVIHVNTSVRYLNMTYEILNRDPDKVTEKSRLYYEAHLIKIHGFFQHLKKDVLSKKKFILYSGHDITLESIAVAMQFYDGLLIKYASRLVFEVYQKGSQLLLRVIYNGLEVTGQIYLCRVRPDQCICTDLASERVCFIDFFLLVQQIESQFDQTVSR